VGWLDYDAAGLGDWLVAAAGGAGLGSAQAAFKAAPKWPGRAAEQGRALAVLAWAGHQKRAFLGVFLFKNKNCVAGGCLPKGVMAYFCGSFSRNKLAKIWTTTRW
jgi:hypothetical protein